MAADSITVEEDYIEYTDFDPAVDLVAARPALQAARTIKCTGAGTLHVKMNGSGGETRTVTVTDGETVRGQFTSIEAGTTGVTRARVGW